jgi:hypothetical protein
MGLHSWGWLLDGMFVGELLVFCSISQLEMFRAGVQTSKLLCYTALLLYYPLLSTPNRQFLSPRLFPVGMWYSMNLIFSVYYCPCACLYMKGCLIMRCNMSCTVMNMFVSMLAWCVFHVRICCSLLPVANFMTLVHSLCLLSRGLPLVPMCVIPLGWWYWTWCWHSVLSWLQSYL